MPPEVIDDFIATQRVDVLRPTTDSRELTWSRDMQPEAERRMLPKQLRLQRPGQLPPKIYTRRFKAARAKAAAAGQTAARRTLGA